MNLINAYHHLIHCGCCVCSCRITRHWFISESITESYNPHRFFVLEKMSQNVKNSSIQKDDLLMLEYLPVL